MSLSYEQRAFVRTRASGCCEYCRLPEDRSKAPFHVDHIRPRSHDGTDEPHNLCLACNDCNAHKGPNISGYDPSTDDLTPLFHPRNQVWSDHFRLEADSVIVGLTPEGRITVNVLKINEADRIEWRQTLLELGEYPCQIED